MIVETLKEVAARQARQLASARVTEQRRPCLCDWCRSGPRRPNRMLVNYASIKASK